MKSKIENAVLSRYLKKARLPTPEVQAVKKVPPSIFDKHSYQKELHKVIESMLVNKEKSIKKIVIIEKVLKCFTNY